MREGFRFLGLGFGLGFGFGVHSLRSVSHYLHTIRAAASSQKRNSLQNPMYGFSLASKFSMLSLARASGKAFDHVSGSRQSREYLERSMLAVVPNRASTP